jgi:hypothetical protein
VFLSKKQGNQFPIRQEGSTEKNGFSVTTFRLPCFLRRKLFLSLINTTQQAVFPLSTKKTLKRV